MTSKAYEGSKNPSLQVTADHKIKLVEAPIESPGPGQVLLHVKATGICGCARIVSICRSVANILQVRHPLLEDWRYWSPCS